MENNIPIIDIEKEYPRRNFTEYIKTIVCCPCICCMGCIWWIHLGCPNKKTMLNMFGVYYQ